MDCLKDKPITVLGAGAVGKACAADCSLAGAKVLLWDTPSFAKKSLFGVKEQGITFYGSQLNLCGFERSGIARFDRVTMDLEEAVEGAGIVIIPTPVVAHRLIFEQLIPLLADDMVIHIFPDNYGSLLLRKMIS